MNDNVCSALNVGGGTLSSVIGAKIGDANSGANNYHNYCTDLEAGEPVPSAFTADNTVWFKFTTPATAGKRYDVTVNANSDPAPDHNDGINLQLALYEATSGCNFAGFTEIASDFDGLLYDETLTATCLKPSTTYYIQLDGSKGFLELFRAQGFGYFGIEVVTDDVYDAPVNDNLCNATNLGTVPVAGQLAPATWFYNSCATLEVGEIDPVGDVIDYDIDKTVWFKFVPGRDADFKISAISDCLIGAGCDPIDLQVGLFRPTGGLAPTCPSLTYATLVQEAADYDPGFFDEDLTAPCLKAGQTYYIQVDGSALNIDGEFQIKIEDVGSSVAAPLNDNFCNATLMTFTAGVASLTNQNNVCATIQASEPQTPASVQKSVWYKFQAPPSGRIRITTHDADGAFRGLDPEFYVYENGPVFNCAAFTNLTANGDDYNPIPDVPIICPNCGDEEVEDECFVPGWWYLIQVDGTTIGGPQGKFDIKIEDLLTPYTVGSGNKPANDDFASATTLTIQTEACQEGTGRTDLHGAGAWDPENYGKSTRDMINGLGSAGCSVADFVAICGINLM
ncbi:MAG: hypothetical protein IPO64_09940 [Bacteroidetes bacterium]|nr:hypothetical protein [Bacteroidota bacterium]